MEIPESPLTLKGEGLKLSPGHYYLDQIPLQEHPLKMGRRMRVLDDEAEPRTCQPKN